MGWLASLPGERQPTSHPTSCAAQPACGREERAAPERWPGSLPCRPLPPCPSRLPAGQARHLGVCPQTGLHVFLRSGLYGPYVQRGKDDDPLFNRQGLPRVSHSLPGHVGRTWWCGGRVACAVCCCGLLRRSPPPGALAACTRPAQVLAPCLQACCRDSFMPLLRLHRCPLCVQNMNVRAVSLEQALSMLALPKDLGSSPATGGWCLRSGVL